MDVFARSSSHSPRGSLVGLAFAAALLLLLGPSAPTVTRGGEARSSPARAAAAPALMPPTRWVDTGGTDVGDCTSAATACRTLGYAIARSVAWDKIQVSAGTFVETASIPFPLYIWGEGAARTFIRGSEPCDPAHIPAVFTIDTASYQGPPGGPRVPQVYLQDMAVGCAAEGIRVFEDGQAFPQNVAFEGTATTGVRVEAGGVFATRSQFGGDVGISAAPDVWVAANYSTFLTHDYGVKADGPLGSLGVFGSRIVGSRVAGIETAGTEAGNAAYGDNWWGCNAGPGRPGCDTVSGPPAHGWLSLGLEAPASVQVGGSASVAAQLYGSDGAVDPDTFTLDAVEFSTRGGGQIVDVAVGQSGPARATVVAPSAPGTFDAVARLDSETVSAPIEVVGAHSPSPAASTSSGATPRATAGQATVTLPPTDLATEQTSGMDSLSVVLVLFATFSAVALMVAVPRRRRML